jgi:hypothetical protein
MKTTRVARVGNNIDGTMNREERGGSVSPSWQRHSRLPPFSPEIEPCLVFWAV